MKVLDSEQTALVLGAPFGGEAALPSEMEATLRKIFSKRVALLDVDHAAKELVLTRLCADVGTLSYHLRINGDRVDEDALHKHDRSLRNSLDAILGGGISDEAWEQASLGVSKGGLGMREAANVALPAFVASRVACRPHVAMLARHLEDAEICSAAAVLKRYDTRTDAALTRLVGTLDPEAGVDLVDELEMCISRADDSWQGLFDEDADDAAGDPATAARRPRAPGFAVLPGDEDGDDEHPDATAAGQSLHIQQLIMRRVDARKVAAVRESMDASSDESGLRRLDELQHEDQDHTWMWALSPHRGPVMDSEDYVEAIRLRLGVAGPVDAIPCALCGVVPMEPSGAHALCCARAESTRGHNNVTRQLAEEVATVDPGMEIEPMGLVPGTQLRPADILTGALGNGLVALDIGIASPDAMGAGHDCTQSMADRKTIKYEPHRAVLDRQNVTY